MGFGEKIQPERQMEILIMKMITTFARYCAFRGNNLI